MPVVAAVTDALSGAQSSHRRRAGAALVAFAAAVSLVFALGGPAEAALVPTVPLGTSDTFAVLASSTVTNTGPSILDGDAGVSPGSAITGFPPGLVLPPGTFHATDGVAAQAQSDLTTAYNNAAGRSLNATTTADLGGLTLQGGVYAGPDKGALGLTGTLVLDGAGDPNTVFIFQTDSTLTTASSSTVSLIGRAQACNVFWQVGSSATLGTSSVFVGNILALTSVTATTGATITGRALARGGAVTLDTNTFNDPACTDFAPPDDTTPVTDDTTPTTDDTTPTTPTTDGTTPPTDGTTGPTVPTSPAATVPIGTADTVPGGTPTTGPRSAVTTPEATSRAVPRGGPPTDQGTPPIPRSPMPPSIQGGAPGVPVAGPPRTGVAPVPASTPVRPWRTSALLALGGGALAAGAVLLASRRDAPSSER